MKKMIFGAAAALLCGSVFATIQSSNIVGYTKSDVVGKQYVQVGTGFIDYRSGEKTFKLSAFVPTSFDCGSDMIQVVSDVNARTLGQYTYVNIEEADGDEDVVGWWDVNIENPMDDLKFDLGQGFKGNFAAKDAAFNTAGQLNQDATEIDYTGKQYVVVPNILPRTVMLGELVGIGTDCGSDMLQRLSTENARTIEAYTYVNIEEADGDEDVVGWWDVNIEEPMNEVEIPVNGALYANFAAKSAKIAFPAPIEK